MAKKKYYAVRKGIKTGIFDTWTECQQSIMGYSNAEYKSFLTRDEAEKYLLGDDLIEAESEDVLPEEYNINPSKIIVYVDGSYDHNLKKYSFGCIILTPSGDIIKESGNGDNPASLAIRNVAGEMLGAMYAVRWAIMNGYSEIEIRYDYEGIEKWVQGQWKAKNELAQKYAIFMNECKSSIKISFCKVTAHSNNKYNDMADALAKSALTEGNGIPKIKRGSYWFAVERISRDNIHAIIELVKEEYNSNILVKNKSIPHGTCWNLSLGKNDKLVVYHYNTNKLVIQGKPQSLFACIINYITELVDIEDIPRIFNDAFKLDIDKENIHTEFQYYLPNSYDKFTPKMERVLHQAVYNLNINGDMFDGTFLAQPALRVLEGHLKKLVTEKEIVPAGEYIKYNGFNMFEQNGAKYQLKEACRGTASEEEINYLGRCYTFYHNNRHILEHWDDPTSPLDTTKILDCGQAHDLIKRTLAVIDDFYAI